MIHNVPMETSYDIKQHKNALWRLYVSSTILLKLSGAVNGYF